MKDRLISAEEARRLTGLPRSTFWDVVNKKNIPRVEFTPKTIRFRESVINQFIAEHTVQSPADRARLADGRRL